MQVLFPNPASDRPKLHCPEAALCGGCPQITLSPARQREKKLLWVQALLDEEALSPASPLSFHPASVTGGYRNRIRLRISEDGEIAFFNREKSKKCAVLSEELHRALHLLLSSANELKESLLGLAHLELRAPDLDGLASLFFTVNAGGHFNDEQRGALRRRLQEFFLLSFDDEQRPAPRYPLVPGSYQRVPIGSFMQINFAVNEALISEVIKGAIERKLTNFADIYCGSGNFFLPLLAAGLEGLAVESDGPATQALRSSMEEQGLKGEVFQTEALSWARTKALESGSPGLDLLVLDPPRAGLKEALPPLAGLNAKNIVLCSCNPKSLVRDLKALCSLGYQLGRCTLFDMFEHTDQVEVLTWLHKSEA